MSARELETIRIKAEYLKQRNNLIEGRVSALKKYLNEDGDQIWEDAMHLLGDQWVSIEELIGMTR